MKSIENVKRAIDSVLANKIRSLLTMLGIIIGISSVIAILAIGNGATNQITETFSELGASMISVSVSPEATNNQKITNKDIEILKKNIPHIQYVSPVTTIQAIGSTTDKTKAAFIMAGTPDLQFTNQLMDKKIIYGRYFNQADYAKSRKVAIISADAARYFFNNRENIIGEKLNLRTPNGQLRINIIGVTKSIIEKMLGFFDEEEMTSYLAMPLTTANQLNPNSTNISNLSILTKSTKEIDATSKQIVTILSTRKKTIGKKIYTATNYLQALNKVNNVLNLFINFIAAVAAIALIVGGIGVMNIMLVSVTERTKEIGIRKALGATDSNILFQFLTESMILCLIGGVIGLLLGTTLAMIVAHFLKITPQFSFSSIVIVLIFSSTIGIFFGVYPAKKAAKLDPIEALRHE